MFQYLTDYQQPAEVLQKHGNVNESNVYQRFIQETMPITLK